MKFWRLHRPGYRVLKTVIATTLTLLVCSRFSGPAALRVRLCMSLPPAVGFYALILALFHTAPPFLQNTLLSAEMPRGMHDYECLCRWLPVWSQVSF